MKTLVLIQNRATLLYFGAAGRWVAAPEKAFDFENRVRASDFINTQSLDDVQIVLSIPGERAGQHLLDRTRIMAVGFSGRSLRVLHVESSSNWGGQESRTVIEAAWLNEHGFPTWIAADPKSEIYKRARDQDVPVVPVAMGSAFNAISVARLFRFAAQHHIDIINTHSSKDSWLCLPLHAAGWPVVRWRNVIIPVPKKYLKRFPYLRACRHIMATAETIREGLVQGTGIPREKIDVVGEGVDLARFHPRVPRSALLGEFQVEPGQVLIGMIALMRPEKGHAYFLEAALQVLRTHPNARFVFAGSGPNRNFGKCRIELALEERLAKESPESRAAIHFLGYREDVPNILAGLDILVIPSISEARCRVLAEGMAMAKPIIATRIGGMTEIIRHNQNGLLVPPADPAALARAMCELIENPLKRNRLAAAGLRTAQSELSLDQVMQQIISCYLRVIDPFFTELLEEDCQSEHHERRPRLEAALD